MLILPSDVLKRDFQRRYAICIVQGLVRIQVLDLAKQTREIFRPCYCGARWSFFSGNGPRYGVLHSTKVAVMRSTSTKHLMISSSGDLRTQTVVDKHVLIALHGLQTA